MRRFPVAFAIMISVIFACASSLAYINTQKTNLYNSLDAAYWAAIDGNIEDSQKYVDTFLEDWMEQEKYLKLVIHRKDLEDIAFSSEVVHEYIKTREIPEFCAEIKRIMALVSHIWETEVPSFSNIF